MKIVSDCIAYKYNSPSIFSYWTLSNTLGTFFSLQTNPHYHLVCCGYQEFCASRFFNTYLVSTDFSQFGASRIINDGFYFLDVKYVPSESKE